MRAIAVARRARAVALMISTGLVVALDAPMARAQRLEGQAPAVAPAQRSRAFDIPAQPLTDALTQFGRQSGLQVSVHGDLLRGSSTGGVNGTMSPEQALAHLLAGTGLVFSISGSGTVTLQKPGAGLAPGVPVRRISDHHRCERQHHPDAEPREQLL